MKKTVLTVAMALTLMAANANTEISTSHNIFNPTSATIIIPTGPDIFCKAIMRGDVETVKSMIDLGEDVNRKSLGKTPAIFAARYNKPEILKLLIENGADLRIKCDKGYTAEKYAELSHAKEALIVIRSAEKK